MNLSDLTEEQIEAWRALAQRPDLVRLLLEFGENMAAGRRVLKWVGWLAGIATGIAAMSFYLHGIFFGHRNG